jgi:hypothetical protein
LETQTVEVNPAPAAPKRKGRPAGSKNLKTNASKVIATSLAALGNITPALDDNDVIDHASNGTGQNNGVQLAPKKIIKRRARTGQMGNKPGRRSGALETAIAVNGHASDRVMPWAVAPDIAPSIYKELGEFAGELGKIKSLMPLPELRTFVAGYLTA